MHLVLNVPLGKRTIPEYWLWRYVNHKGSRGVESLSWLLKWTQSYTTPLVRISKWVGRINLWLRQEMMRFSLIDAIGTGNHILFQNIWIEFSQFGDKTFFRWNENLPWIREIFVCVLFQNRACSWVLFAKREQSLKISPHIGNLVWHMWVSVDQASCFYHLSQTLFWKGENATKNRSHSELQGRNLGVRDGRWLSREMGGGGN